MKSSSALEGRRGEERVRVTKVVERARMGRVCMMGRQALICEMLRLWMRKVGILGMTVTMSLYLRGRSFVVWEHDATGIDGVADEVCGRCQRVSALIVQTAPSKASTIRNVTV